jgi:hypothetical protein
MPNEEVQMEKLDFSGGLEEGGNAFGIEDTQVLASKDLNTFLLSNPDDVKNIEEENRKAEAARVEAEKLKQQQQSSKEVDENGKPIVKQPVKTEAQKKEDESEQGRKALEKSLFNTDEEDEEDTTGKPKNTNTPAKPANEQGEEDETYVTLGKDLMRLGVFTKNSDDESEENIDIKTPEQFLERFNLEKKKGAISILDNFLGQFGEEYRKMFDAVFVNGVKPQDYLQSFAKIESFKTLDLTDETNQERVMRAYYKELKWDDERINSKIQKLKDYGDLEEEAKSYHEVLLNKEKETAAQIEQKKIDEQKQEKDRDIATAKSLQRIITEKLKTQEIDGVPLTQKDAEEVFAYLTNKPYKLASGEKLTEFDKDILELNRPENHELKIKLGLLLRKKLDLTSVKKTTISKKSDALFTLSTKNAKQKDSKEKEIKSFF